MSRPPFVYADARPDTILGIWIATYVCACDSKHSFSAGPLTSVPTGGGTRRAPCGQTVHVDITMNRTRNNP